MLMYAACLLVAWLGCVCAHAQSRVQLIGKRYLVVDISDTALASSTPAVSGPSLQGNHKHCRSVCSSHLPRGGLEHLLPELLE